MELELNEKYHLTSDEHNYTLQKITYTKKTGEKRYAAIGHYKNLEHLVNGLTEHSVKTSELDNIEDLIQLMGKIKTDLTQMLTEHENKIAQDVKEVNQYKDSLKPAKSNEDA